MLLRALVWAWVVRWALVHAWVENATQRFYTGMLNDLLRNYDKSLRPQVERNSTVVTLDYFLKSLQLDDDGQLTIDGYLRQRWRDPRLSVRRLVYRRARRPALASVQKPWRQRQHAKLLQKLFGKTYERAATLHWLVVSSIWRPDTVFMDQSSGHMHIVTVPNRLLRIYWDGDVLLSQRFTVRQRCRLLLKYFPMDEQTCSIGLFSFAFDDSDIVYEWRDGLTRDALLSADITLAQFHIEDAAVFTKRILLNRRPKSVAVLQLRMHRHTGYYMLSIYLPCVALVMLTTLNFFFSPQQISDRITLCLTCILTMAFLIQDGRRSESAVVSETEKSHFVQGASIHTVFAWLFSFINVTALELYLFVCLMFLLLAVVENVWIVRYTATWAVLLHNPSLFLSGELFHAVTEQLSSGRTSGSTANDPNANEQGATLLSDQPATWPKLRCKSGRRASLFRSFLSLQWNGADGSMSSGEGKCEGVLNSVHPVHLETPLKKSFFGKRCGRRRKSSAVEAATGDQSTLDAASHLDRIVRIVYPLAFFIFNGFYWYLLKFREDETD